MTEPAAPPGYAVVGFDTLDSTNEEARRRATKGERGPLWIWARRQSAGRGRRGRAWESPAGNLMCTLLLSPGVPPMQAARLSFVAALAVHELVGECVLTADVRVKWPNDVLVNGRKVAGILLESSGEGGEVVPWLAVGIGVNLLHAPKTVAQPTAAVIEFGAVPVASEALSRLAAAWDRHYRTWRAQGFGPIREAWLARAAGLGQEAEARLPGETVKGRFETLDADGALILALPNGARRAITAGEVFFASP